MDLGPTDARAEKVSFVVWRAGTMVRAVLDWHCKTRISETQPGKKINVWSYEEVYRQVQKVHT